MFHQNFIPSTQAAKSLDHHANSSAYLNQALAICHTDCTNLHAKQLIKDNKGTSVSLGDFINITKVTVIPRTHHRIAYVMDYLHTNFHGTYILDPSCASSRIFGKIFDHIPINVIDYEQNGHDSPSDGVVIKTETMCDDVATLSLELEYVSFLPYLYCTITMTTTNHSQSSFSNNRSLFPILCPFMDMSTSKERKTASFSSGYSNSNCHDYKNNRINQVGSYSPFLMDKDLLELPAEIRRRIAILICGTVKLFETENRYVETTEEKDAGSPRLQMRLEFWKLLGMTMEGNDADMFQYFLCEGFSLISEFMLHFHQDKKNDPSSCYGGTYSIKAPIKLTEELLKNSTISLLAKRYNLSIGDILPISFMIYSRKSCGDNTIRDVKISKCLRGEVGDDCSILLKAVMAGINDIKRPERNYSAKWDNPAKYLDELVMGNMDSYGLTEDSVRGKKAKDDLRRFKAIPTQFNGKHASHLPSYDKMSFWSIIIDLLLDIAVNVKPDLSAEDVMGYIIFCSLECNGTVLPVGLITTRMKDSKSRATFKQLIESDGMYYTLLRDSIELAADRRTNTYGCSAGNRHQSHNRTFFDKPGKSRACSNPAGIPVFNVTPSYANDNDGTSNHQWDYADSLSKKKDFKALRVYCKHLEASFLVLCKEGSTSLSAKKAPTKKSKKKITTKAKSTPAAEEMSAFLLAVQKLGGNGCGHIFSLNFVQLSSCFGFLPTNLMTYSSVQNVNSGGYQLIKQLYEGSGIEINPLKAQSLFESTIKHLRKIFTHNVSYPYVENMLCELWREYGGKTVIKKDYFFFLPHRKNAMNGMQNFARFQYESGSTMCLEMMPISMESIDTENPITQAKVQLIKWEKKRMNSKDGVITWVQPSDCNGVHETAIFKVDDVFGTTFYRCRKEKRKAIEVVDLTVDLDAPIQKKKRK